MITFVVPLFIRFTQYIPDVMQFFSLYMACFICFIILHVIINRITKKPIKRFLIFLAIGLVGMIYLQHYKVSAVVDRPIIKIIKIEYMFFLLIRLTKIPGAIVEMIKSAIKNKKAKNTVTNLYVGRTCYYGIIDHPNWCKGDDLIFQPIDSLTRTIMILGDMGVGKTRLLKIFCEYSEQFTAASLFIHDPKGEWLRSEYNEEKDLIFAPYDERSVAWDIWGDMEEYPELIDLICKGAVLHHQKKEEDSYWVSSASTLLADALTTGDIIKSREFLITKREQSGDNKTFLSTYATALAGFRDIVSISLSSGRKIKLDEFINNKNSKTFLLNTPAIRESNAGPLNIFLTALLAHLISLPNTKSDAEIRAMFLIDEALQFNLPDTIETALITTARSKGISFIGSIQHLPPKWQGETHLTKAQTKYIFRCSDPTTSKEVSDWTEFEYEKEVVTHSETSGHSPHSRSSTTSYHTEKRRGHQINNIDLNGLESRKFFLIRQGKTILGSTKAIEMIERDEVKVTIYNSGLKKLVREFMNGL